MSLQERAERVKQRDRRAHLGGRLDNFESLGRHQFETLIHEGLYPSSKVVDVGCGALRAGYWLMTFLDPGCYFGIEPYRERLQVGLDHIVEPEVLERAQPHFDHNEDFDLGVFGVEYDFVLARSIWTHTSKRQIVQMLDSFVASSAPRAAMLVSYLPASRLPETVRVPLMRGLTRTKLLPTWRRLIGPPPRFNDYTGDEWQAPLIGHRFEWVEQTCAERGLVVRELDDGVVNRQVWLRIERRG